MTMPFYSFSTLLLSMTLLFCLHSDAVRGRTGANRVTGFIGVSDDEGSLRIAEIAKVSIFLLALFFIKSLGISRGVLTPGPC